MLAAALLPLPLKSQFVESHTTSTEKIFYDTTAISVFLSAKDTMVWVKSLSVKLQAFQAGNVPSVNDIPLRYINYFSSLTVKPRDVGTCAFPCSAALKPILANVIAREIERTRIAIAKRERLIDSLFPPEKAVKHKKKQR